MNGVGESLSDVRRGRHVPLTREASGPMCLPCRARALRDEHELLELETHGDERPRKVRTCCT